MKEAKAMFRRASRVPPNLFFTACPSPKYTEAPTGWGAETVTWDALLLRNPQRKSFLRNKSGPIATGMREEGEGRG